ncbi:MBOAT family O-acyltransferase [Lagierella sp.]|uniref:MBOAT family O-acyltransferase n=1 Tax=Lagierella sp. TaxID=2849657 RepID=UPI0026103EFE|nr:MBOAT family O-acyltransferase [Lagierella sp.]
MSFTTQTFLFIFFPLSMILYHGIRFLGLNKTFSHFLEKYRIEDLTIIGISFVFYSWAFFSDSFRFLIYIFTVFFLGKAIEKYKNFSVAMTVNGEGENNQKITAALPILFLSIVIVLFVLIHFKYTGLIAQAWNFLFRDGIKAKSYLAPLGISFITFSAISYLVDIYRGDASAGSLIDCALYLLFFPKVISGPIVLWKDFSREIYVRKIDVDSFSSGINRIMIGFSKKLILADTFGECIALASDAIDVPTSWGVALLYMLQIYFDFSGYSDIALGLSNLMGFDFQENFNFPYLSQSITEFWRRWHISLGKWFREYVYFPLGGSRRSERRTILNVAIVFTLTGIWHGAGWTYMLWGMVNGLCNIIEKLVSQKNWYKKTPKIIKWLYAMTITFFSWELFRFSSFSEFTRWFKIMFGRVSFENIPYTWRYYFDNRMIFLVIMGVIGATVFGLPSIQEKYKNFVKKPMGYAIKEIVFIGLFIISILFMVNSTYSPFIYFQY